MPSPKDLRNSAGQPLGFCEACFRVRWLAVTTEIDNHGTPHGTCRSCAGATEAPGCPKCGLPDSDRLAEGCQCWRDEPGPEGDDWVARTSNIQDFSRRLWLRLTLRRDVRRQLRRVRDV